MCYITGMKSTTAQHGHPADFQDPVSLNDPVWTILHMALLLDVKPDSLSSVVNSPNFPRPLANQHRNRRWWAEDVRAFFIKRSQGLLPALAPKKIDRSQSPKSMRLKD
jgi:hypothetical protein